MDPLKFTRDRRGLPGSRHGIPSRFSSLSPQPRVCQCVGSSSPSVSPPWLNRFLRLMDSRLIWANFSTLRHLRLFVIGPQTFFSPGPIPHLLSLPCLTRNQQILFCRWHRKFVRKKSFLGVMTNKELRFDL
jgi:hypothetical protein